MTVRPTWFGNPGHSANFFLTMPITSLFTYALIPVGGAGGNGGKGADGTILDSDPDSWFLKGSPGGRGGRGGMNSAFGGSGGGGGGAGQWYYWIWSGGYPESCSPGAGGKGAGNGGAGPASIEP